MWNIRFFLKKIDLFLRDLLPFLEQLLGSCGHLKMEHIGLATAMQCQIESHWRRTFVVCWPTQAMFLTNSRCTANIGVVHFPDMLAMPYRDKIWTFSLIRFHAYMFSCYTGCYQYRFSHDTWVSCFPNFYPYLVHVVYGLTAFTNLNDQIVKNIIARGQNFILVPFSNYITYVKEKRNKCEQKKIYSQHPQINALHACNDMCFGPYKICPLYNSHATIWEKYRDTWQLQATIRVILCDKLDTTSNTTCQTDNRPPRLRIYHIPRI